MKDLMQNKFHPFEIAFSGYSGSGKTTLIEKLMKKLSKNYSVAFIKNDIHGFQMDKEGKDTYRIYHAGADSTYISSPKERAYLSKKPLNYSIFKQELLLYDIAIIEGYKDENIAKYLISDYEKVKNIDFKLNKYKNLLGVITKNKNEKINNIKTFNRNDIDAIYDDMLANINLRKPKLNALILVGGQSSRMGEDKGLINYHGNKQVDFLYDLLSPFVENVFVSVNSSQAILPEYNKYKIINDIIPEIGPIGGITSKFFDDNNNALLVVACDIPLMNQEMIIELITNRNFLKFGTFFSSEYKFEPLLGIYEPKSFQFLMNSIINKKYGIKNAFKELELNIIDNRFIGNFRNINTQKEKEELLK